MDLGSIPILINLNSLLGFEGRKENHIYGMSALCKALCQELYIQLSQRNCKYYYVYCAYKYTETQKD